MKVLCFIDSLGAGGAQRQLVGLAMKLKELGYSVDILVYHRESFHYKAMKNQGIPVHEILEANYVRRVVCIVKFLVFAKYNVVISFLDVPNIISAIASIVRRDCTYIVGERSANPAIAKTPKLRIFRLFHFFADYIVSNSDSNIQLCMKANPLVRKNKYRLIHNMVIDQRLCRDNEYIDYKKKIVVLASHSYNKNIINMIKAVNILPSEFKNRLEILWYGDTRGDGSIYEAKELIDKYNLKNFIKLMPTTPHTYEVICKSDIVALFSFYEGFPNALSEAMMHRRLIISSRVSDIPKIIQNENLLFEPGNVNDIKSAIIYAIELSNSEYNDIVNLNYETANKYFNPDFVVQHYIDLFSHEENVR